MELSGVDGKTDNDSKRTGKKIKIKAEIGLGLTVWFAVRLLLTAWLTWTSLLVCMHLAELERGYSGAVGGEILLAAVVGVLCWKLLGRRR